MVGYNGRYSICLNIILCLFCFTFITDSTSGHMVTICYMVTVSHGHSLSLLQNENEQMSFLLTYTIPQSLCYNTCHHLLFALATVTSYFISVNGKSVHGYILQCTWSVTLCSHLLHIYSFQMLNFSFQCQKYVLDISNFSVSCLKSYQSLFSIFLK